MSRTTLGWVSLLCGSASIACFIFVQAPQIIKNFRQGNADGLALSFLMFWLSGDLCNFIGCILTEQSLTQTLLAVWFIIADLTLFLQAVYFQKCVTRVPETSYFLDSTSDPGPEGLKNPQKRDSLTQLVDSVDSVEYQPQTYSFVQNPARRSFSFCKSVSTKLISPMTFILLLSTLQSTQGSDDCDVESCGNDNLTLKKEIGLGFAFASAICYMTSRLPQLYKNFSRKSTEGLSLVMFFLSIAGNFLYGVSVLTDKEEIQHWKIELPFLLGSLGTMSEDMIIFCQFLYYGEKKPKKDDDSLKYTIQEYNVL